MATQVGLVDYIYTVLLCLECGKKWAVVPMVDYDLYYDIESGMGSGYKVAADGAICPTCPTSIPDVIHPIAVRTANGKWIPVPQPPLPDILNSEIGTLPPKSR